MLSTSNQRRTSHYPDLSAIWRKAIEAGQLVGEFEAPHDDPEGRWKHRDKIVLGLTHTAQGFCYFAQNLSTKQVIRAAFAEKEISGTEFRCQLNGYRRLRPGASLLTPGRQPGISPHPIECRFYCQDSAHKLSLLHRTPLAQMKLKHHLWNAYYNAAPLKREGHFIWLPVRTVSRQLTLPHYLQTLESTVIEDIFLLHDRSANYVLLFNSLHAGATVNHLHVHTVYRKHPLAIEQQQATAYGRFSILEAYPAAGFLFEGSQAAALVTDYVLRLQECGIPFNLIWTGGRVFLLPRNIEHEVTEEFPLDVFSAMEMGGEIVTTDRATYDAISKERIEAALTKTALAADDLLREWKAG